MPSHGGIFELSHLDYVYLILPAVVQAVVYGLYVALFWRCMYIFRKRQLGQGHKVILTGTVLLFSLCSIQCILSSFPDTILVRTILYNTIYVVTNLIADSLFTYRCYVIWGRKKSILWVPLCLILAETAFGALSAAGGPVIGEVSSFNINQRAPLYITLATNVMLTLLSAGRIWWVSRELKILGPKVSQKYNTAIALIVESGAMYCVFIIAYIISIPADSDDGSIDSPSNPFTPYIASNTFFGLLNQVVGIVPTLIVVRIGLGVSTEDAQTVILASGIRFNRGEESSGRVDVDDQIMERSNRETRTVAVGRVV